MILNYNVNWSKVTASFLFMNFLCAQVHSQSTTMTPKEASEMYKSNVSMTHASVHDPSVVYDSSSEQYYIFGSHRATAKTKDLQNWSYVDTRWAVESQTGTTIVDNYNGFTTNHTKEITINGKKVSFGNFDASDWNCGLNDRDWANGNMWAPDIIYNPTMGKWCQYLSLNGPEWNSVIILLTAENIEGPYIYQGPVVYTGFRNSTNSQISYKKTDLELVLGTQNSLPSKYNQGEAWGNIWPHAIDPTVFFDEEGKLWMAYGSWSGGIYILELDESTGLRDYDVTYESNYDSRKSAVTTDEYFGKKIAGGCYVSGEGPYIQFMGEHYYLIMSNGGYAPDGGYEMRIFRSKNPDGPYLDLNNKSAIYSSWALNFGLNADKRGSKLLGSYNNWGFQTVGECAQGHNSAIVGPDGNSYLVYHTKFNDGTFGHLVRVHQMFMNKNGWPVVAPFEYNGESVNEKDIATKSIFTKNEIIGNYDVILHKYELDHSKYEEVTPQKISLNEDGTVTGAYSGTWTTQTGNSYISLSLNGLTYEGVVIEQQMEPTTIKAICFTACNNSGVQMWGHKMQDKYAMAYAINNLSLPFKNNGFITSHLDLHGISTSDNVNVEWNSDKPLIISNNGIYNPTGMTSYEPVNLSLKMTCGDYVYSEDYNVYAREEMTYTGDHLSGMVAHYDFDTETSANAFNTTQTATFRKQGSNIKPSLEIDKARVGNVVHQYFGANANTSYTQILNPLKNETIDGATISMWIKRNDDNVWDAICSFFNSSKNSRLYLTGNSYLGFNNGSGDWLDINHPNTVTSENIPVGKWTHLVMTFSRKNGYNIYINGVIVRNNDFNGSCSGNTVTNNVGFDHNLIVDLIQSSSYFYLGYGSFWGSADVCFDDLILYNRELSSSDIRALNKYANRVYDYAAANGATGIDDIKADKEEGNNTIYDIKGRVVNNPENGIYIINGTKKYIK